MSGGRHEFFRGLETATAGDFINLIFEVAYFWKLSPFDLMTRALSEVFELKLQQNRIGDLIAKEIGRNRN